MLDKGKICQKIAKCFVLLTKQGLILTACLFWYLVFFLLNCCSQLCSGLYMWYVLNLSVDLFCKCLCYWRVFFTFCCALPPWASAGSVQYIQRFFLSICTLCIYILVVPYTLSVPRYTDFFPPEESCFLCSLEPVFRTFFTFFCYVLPQMVRPVVLTKNVS